MGAYEPKPVRQIFTELAFALFGGRLEVVGERDADFQGEIALAPLRDVLDEICAQSQCSWSVEGSPPTLVLFTEGSDR